MKCHIPLLKSCCVFWRFHSDNLIMFGFTKLMITALIILLYSAFLIVLNNKTGEILGIYCALTVDFIICIMFVIGCEKKNAEYLSWFYPFNLCWFMVKIILLFVLGFFTPILVLPYLPQLAFHIYMMLILRTIYIRHMCTRQTQCEFVNRLSGPECIVKLEVEDYAGLDKGANKNSINIMDGLKFNKANEEIMQNNLNEKKDADIKHEDMEKFDKFDAVPLESFL